MNQYHILNGDALKSQFPKKIEGKIIVARECLVDGDVTGEDLGSLFATRAKFLSKHYGATQQEYTDKVAHEFKRIQNIEAGAEINLWFEDDLFCQVNMWFVLHVLTQTNKKNKIYLVRPQKHTQYGFGGLDQAALISIYEHRTVLTEMDMLTSLWSAYQAGDVASLLEKATKLEEQYPFILAAVKAHQERIPTKEDSGRPTQSLKQIMEDLNTDDFGTIFKEFCKRESIYGYGDLQVKRLLDQIR